MKRPGQPLFLARQSYRRRRLADAARLLPVVGLFLFMLPILWQTGRTPEPDTAWGGLYLFLVWALLILATLILSVVLGRNDVAGDGRDKPATPPARG